MTGDEVETKNCKKLIFGATFYGVSKLMRDPKNCILIERGFIIGSEFVDSFNERVSKNIDVSTDFGKQYKDELRRLNLIDENGTIYPAPALFLLCDYLKKTSPSTLFFTEVTQIDKKDGKYSVTIFNSDGFSIINADEIIDTTSMGVLNDCINRSDAKKSLNLIIEKPSSDELLKKDNVVYNPMMNALIYRFPVELKDDYITARKNLQHFWRNDLHKKWGCNIILTASTFAYSMPYTKIEISPQHWWIPSCGFENLLHAVDEGQVCSL